MPINHQKKTLFILLSSTWYMFYFIDWLKIKKTNVKLILIIDNESLIHIKPDIRLIFSEIIIVPLLKHTYKRELCIHAILQKLNTIIKYKSDNYKFYSFNEFNFENVIFLRKKFNHTGNINSYNYRNKVAMKDFNIPCQKPNYINISKNINNSYINFFYLEDKLLLPFVIKPVNGAGSYGVTIIYCEDDYKNFIANYDDSFEYIAEEYINGDLFHADLVYSNGKIIFESVCKYNYPLSEFFEDKVVGSIVLEQSSNISKKLMSLNRYLIPDLNLTGTLHTEFFVNNSGVYLLEVAHRPPGGPITKMYEKSFGVNILELEIKLLLDIPVILNSKKNFSYWAFVPPREGIVKKIKLSAFYFNHEIQYNIQPQQKLIQPSSLRDKVASLLCSGDNFQMLMSQFEQLKVDDFYENY